MHRLLPCILLCLCLPTAHAGVYTYIDSDGNRVFTDQPPSEKAERIEITPSNRMATPQAVQPRKPDSAPSVRPGYYVVRILFPEPDATVRDAAGNLMVTVNSEPNLHEDHSYRLLMDGQPLGEPGRSPVFPLQNIDRGTHQLSLEILDSNGRIVERTPSQPFHMKRTTLADKRRTNPCKKGEWGVRPECPLKDKPADPPKNIPFIPFI